LHDFIADGFGLFQLPCPEVSYLGMKRWGMTREQYDHPNFRSHCQSLLHHPITQIEAFSKAGYEIFGVAGMDGSPNCGVHFTCEGFSGGEIGHPDLIAAQVSELRRVAGQGVFMSILLDMLQAIDIQPKLMAVQEPDLAGRSVL
jgi:predicted secreted protein